MVDLRSVERGMECLLHPKCGASSHLLMDIKTVGERNESPFLLPFKHGQITKSRDKSIEYREKITESGI